ncbi:hypothetical protein CYMTET_17190 [Cymbomonas tetramitiformis]|uniref:Uncharacterized protein n=1 Tax=Cymbomonas tetramitiformis TaxID=36881 RepID=A0AAE0GB04_9CHLO|nr:hypothetical protein CYMTET_17190 [Cymbomonas tetramitiformis]
MTVANMGVTHQRDGYQCGVWVCYMVDKWQEWNRSATGATWESWIGLHGPAPEGREAVTSKMYRETMRGPIMARIGELEQRERHHMFHGEGDSHDPISFEEGGDEIPEAGAGPMVAQEVQVEEDDPNMQTQAGIVPKISGRAPEAPRVGAKRTRPTIQSPPATVEREENGPRTGPPARGAALREANQGEPRSRSLAGIRLDDGKGMTWKGTATHVVTLIPPARSGRCSLGNSAR